MSNRAAASLPFISCLESFLSPAFVTPSSPSSSALNLLSTPVAARLKNLGHPRIRDMRALGHTTQIVSHIPISTTPQVCTKLNDALDSGTRMQHDKVVPLALLPSGQGEGREAARELQRCVTKLKFAGAVVAIGAGFEATGFEEVWLMAQRLGVPIVLREDWPTGDQIAEYTQDLPNSIVAPLVSYLHSTHSSSPMLILRLYITGVFDRFPYLRLVVAHAGLLPSLLPRINTILDSVPAAVRPKRGFLDVWQQNLYLTTVDVFDLPSMRALLEQIPLDHVLYASNYPLEERGRALMTELKDSGFLTDEEWEKLAWKNAEQLFMLNHTELGPHSANARMLAKSG